MNLIIIRVKFLAIFLKYVISDCGLPAIPFNAQIDKIQQIYIEGESIQYHCQLSELKLIGNSSRKCINNQWIGTIPRCVEELNFGTISAIDLADRRNHTIEYRGHWRYRENGAAYSDNYKTGNCLKSSKMSRPHTWKIHLTKEKRHISYIEVLVYDKYKQLAKKDVTKIIKFGKVNNLRECVPQLMETNDNTLRVSLTCLMEFDGDSMHELWEKDVSQMITIEFDVDDITICEIRLFTNSFMPFHRCGSADIILHSTMEFIKTGNKYSRSPYYKYKCDEGFELQGSEDVRCGLNNFWLDRFPTCKPISTCPYPPKKHDSISVNFNFENVFSFNGTMRAIIGSVVTYNCVGSNNKSIMIGDSVTVCGRDGNWTGNGPQCVDQSELNSGYYNDIRDYNSYQNKTSLELTLNNSNQTSIACGIPAMPLFAKPTSSKRFRIFGAQSDLRRRYENGTVIYYQCESAYRWVTGDVDKRTCVNGTWKGRVGKCAINYGNKIKLYSIYVFDQDKGGKWINNHHVMESNSTNIFDEHFAYRRDPDKSECATFTVESQHRWRLRLNQSVSITYFVAMFHPGGFFGKKRRVTDPKILETTPITAEIGKRQCVLTQAWDYSYSRVGTFFFFTCDMEENKQTYDYGNNFINIYIDPKRFVSSYKTTNISLCSLAVMVSKAECGTPDIPLHSTVNFDSNTNQWIYSCDDGYQLSGPKSIYCGKNGRWAGEFPTCVRTELCPSNLTLNSKNLFRNYINSVLINNKKVAIIDSLANYSCISNTKSKQILIGSSLRMCTKVGQWSGTEPYCIDSSILNKYTKRNHSVGTVFGVIIGVFGGLALLIGTIYYAHKKGCIGVPQLKVPNFIVPKINIQSATVESASATPNIYETPDNLHSPQQRSKSTKINEKLPTFSNGKEYLVEPDNE